MLDLSQRAKRRAMMGMTKSDTADSSTLYAGDRGFSKTADVLQRSSHCTYQSQSSKYRNIEMSLLFERPGIDSSYVVLYDELNRYKDRSTFREFCLANHNSCRTVRMYFGGQMHPQRWGWHNYRTVTSGLQSTDKSQPWCIPTYAPRNCACSSFCLWLICRSSDRSCTATSSQTICELKEHSSQGSQTSLDTQPSR